MPWFSRITRFGDVHFCFGQENEVACGIACVIMAAFKVNKFTPGVKAEYDEKGILRLAKKLIGPDPLGEDGLSVADMLKILNAPELTMNGWELLSAETDGVSKEITHRVGVTGGLGPVLNVNPVIMLVQWKTGKNHWVVIDTCRQFLGKTYATVCDPWDGTVHVVPVPADGRFIYAAHDVIDSEFWGKQIRRKVLKATGIKINPPRFPHAHDKKEVGSSTIKWEDKDESSGDSQTIIAPYLLARK
jgi:hypothetical protein